MITDKDDLLDSLKFSYIQYKQSINDNNPVKVTYTQGYSIALEDILNAYYGVQDETIEELRKDFLGETPLERIHVGIKRIDIDERQ